MVVSAVSSVRSVLRSLEVTCDDWAADETAGEEGSDTRRCGDVKCALDTGVEMTRSAKLSTDDSAKGTDITGRDRCDPLMTAR